MRTHQYLVKEEHRTYHYTTTRQEAVTNSKGEITGYRTVTDHHSGSEDLDHHETFQTPDSEMTIDNKISDLQTKILNAQSRNEIEKVQREISLLIKKQADYAASDSTHNHDYSEKFQARNINQLNALKALFDQTVILGVQAENNFPDYNRGVEPSPTWQTGVVARLRAIDETHGRHLRTLGTTAAITAVGAGAACFIYLSGVLQ